MLNPRKTLAISFFDQMLDLLLISLLNFSPLSLTESSISYFLLALAGFNNVPLNINSMRKTVAANTTTAKIIRNADNMFSMQYLVVCQQSGPAS